MRCFKSLNTGTFLLIIVSALFMNNALGALYYIEGSKNKTLKTGDHATVLLVPAQERGVTPELLGKHIADSLYVMKQNGRSLDVIVTGKSGAGAPGGDKDDQKDKFEIRGFDVSLNPSNPQQGAGKDYLIEETSYDVGGMGNIIWLFVACLALFFAPKIAKQVSARKRNALEKKALLKDLERLEREVVKARERAQLENIYKERDKILAYFDFKQSSYEAFAGGLEGLQYKKEWTEDEHNTLLELHGRFIKELSIKSGI